MSDLRRNVMMQLTKENRVLDTSTSCNINPVLSYYQNIDVGNDDGALFLHEVGHKKNKENYLTQSQTQEELHFERHAFQGTSHEPQLLQTISPFSCASDLLRCTPISGLGEIAESRAESPLVYEDISDCTIQVQVLVPEFTGILCENNLNISTPVAESQSDIFIVHSFEQLNPPLAANNCDVSPYYEQQPCNENKENHSCKRLKGLTHASPINGEEGNKAEGSGLVADLSVGKDTLPGNDTFQAFIPPENSSTPKQNISTGQLNLDEGDEFGRNIEELIEQLSSEQNSTKESKNDHEQEPKKRIRDPAKKLEVEKKKYPLLPPCNGCTKKCSFTFSDEERENIWTDFRNLNKQSQRNFISRNVLKITKKVTTVKQSRRHNTFKWQLNKIPVCKQFFLSTLGFKFDQTVITILKANVKRGVKNPEIQEAAPEQRGNIEPWNKFPEDYKKGVKQFIQRQQPTVSHYNIKHAPKRRYLPCGVTFSDLYKDYTNYCIQNGTKICSWAYFHQVIKEMNLSTANPTQDLCTTCTNHEKNHPKTDENDHQCDTCDCMPCKTYEQHETNKRLSRQLLNKELENLNPDTKIVTADMQKVIMMPKQTVKDNFFSKKVALSNETFASPGKNKPAYCIVWHEGEAGKMAHNVASAYVQFISKFCKDEKEIIIYSDNCTSQNKNRILFSALLHLVNSPALISAEKIRIVFLEPGHTYMAADTVHANISKKFARYKDIYDKDDFIDKIKKSRKNLEVLEITHREMIIFKDDLKRTFPKNYNIMVLKIVEFRRGATSLFLKKFYDEKEFKEFPALKREIHTLYKKGENDLIKNIERETKPRGISSAKKQDLLKLCSSMPLPRRKFFEDLDINDDVRDSDVDAE